jgi:hypothetical protein
MTLMGPISETRLPSGRRTELVGNKTGQRPCRAVDLLNIVFLLLLLMIAIVLFTF